MVPQSLVHSGGRSPKQQVPFVAGVGGETSARTDRPDSGVSDRG
jgi:hypothetical protein